MYKLSDIIIIFFSVCINKLLHRYQVKIMTLFVSMLWSGRVWHLQCFVYYLQTLHSYSNSTL